MWKNEVAAQALFQPRQIPTSHPLMKDRRANFFRTWAENFYAPVSLSLSATALVNGNSRARQRLCPKFDFFFIVRACASIFFPSYSMFMNIRSLYFR